MRSRAQLPTPRGKVKGCNCGDIDNCRICAVKEAHKHRIAGDEKMYEQLYQKALGLMNIERGGPATGSNRRIR